MQMLQLSIPEPCHENWQQMTPTEQGRFCNACAKEVIDFSTMTDIQVLNYFTNLTHEKVCGRALPEQLDRTISRPAEPKKRLFWYWNYFVMFFMFFAKGNNAKAQSCTKPATELSPVKNVELRGDVVIVAGQMQSTARQMIATGKVTDKDGKPVYFASIKIKGTNTGVSADANGAYSVKVNSNAILIISGAGYKTAEVLVGNQIALNTILVKTVTQTTIRLGTMIAINKSNDPLYVIDGIPTKKANDIKPEDIDNISILKAPETTLLYGTDGANGAIVITTKKLKVKNLDTVSISAGLNRKVNAKMLGGMTAGYRITYTYLADTRAKLITILTDSLKVYPNPVKRNSSFSLSLKLKEAGTHQIQFTDVTGKIILQKIINTVGKNHVEMLQSQNWTAGIYYVRVFNKNKLISNTSFIVD